MSELIAVSCIIFPKNLKYWSTFVNSLSKQDLTKFTLTIFNDGCTVRDIETGLKDYPLQYEIINCHGSIPEIRAFILNHFCSSGFEKIVFLDSDDFIPENYVKVLATKLNQSEAVICDVTLVDGFGKIIEEKIWSGRLKNDQVFRQRDIVDYNIFGLGNSAVQKSFLKTLTIPENIKAVDWFVFFILLENKSFVFTNETSLMYRQHNDNIQGIKPPNPDTLKSINKLKINHYRALIGTYPNLKQNLRNEMKIKELLNNESMHDEVESCINKEKKCYFWWEETLILKNLI